MYAHHWLQFDAQSEGGSKPAEERAAQLSEHLLYSKYLHDIFDARFDDAEYRACSQVAQKSDRAEEVAESKAVLREDAILLAIKVHPSSLQYQPARGHSGVNCGRRMSRKYDLKNAGENIRRNAS